METLLSIDGNSNSTTIFRELLPLNTTLFTIGNKAENMTLGERVAQLRLRLDWSYGQLAERSGISRGYLHNLEKGDRVPKLPIRRKLAAAFGLSLEELLQGVDLETGEVPPIEPEGTGKYPDLMRFEAMLLDTRRRNPKLARTIIKIGLELMEEEERNYQEDRKLDAKEAEARVTGDVG